MGLPSYMQSVVDRNVVMRCIAVFSHDYPSSLTANTLKKEADNSTEKLPGITHNKPESSSVWLHPIGPNKANF